MERMVLTNDPVLQEDLERIAADEQICWEKLKDRTILVTGATGLIGSVAARALVLAGAARDLHLKVLALIRNEEKGKQMLGSCLPYGLRFVRGDIAGPLDIPEKVDFIIHGASVTTSRDFVEHPVETIRTTYAGTENVLRFAKEQKIEGMVYLSSMEAYGVVDPAHFEVRETDYGYIDPLQPRSSYSEGKRIAEGLCAAYAHEYGLPVKIARLAQTFGAGVPAAENRVFAQFAKSVIRGEDVVLHTDGSKAHCYCYTSDAVRGILTVLLKGLSGEAYNVSNEDTFSTIRQMAELVIGRYPESGSKLVIDIPEDAAALGYAPPSRMLIRSDKLRSLGWAPEVDLAGMYERLISSMGEVWAK